MKNFKSVTFCFGYSQWLSDDHVYGDTPKLIQEWANLIYPNRYFIDPNWHEEGFHVTFTNIPKTFVSWTLLSLTDVKLVEEIEFAPIHPDVLPLFDFGDGS